MNTTGKSDFGRAVENVAKSSAGIPYFSVCDQAPVASGVTRVGDTRGGNQGRSQEFVLGGYKF